MSEKGDSSTCPICNKSYPMNEIEGHANKCIFLNASESPAKRKRSVSPAESNTSHHRNESKKSPFTSDITNIPLCKQVIPNKIEDFIGQNHVLGEATMLFKLIKQGDIPNMILWGPPGSGKTSLASVIKHLCKSEPEKYTYHSLNAAQIGVKEFQTIHTQAINDMKNSNKKTVVFIDEIHRFNKKQQDVLLGPIENGEITLVCATTENPAFELNKALLSRARLVIFEKLPCSDVEKILKKAAELLGIHVYTKDSKREEFQENKTYMEESALQWLANTCNGDARIALNNFELIQKHFSQEGKVITYYDVKEGVKKSHLLYDKKGDEHYHMISALHKSIRGSDANASLYWLTRMIMAGEQPLYIARRLIRAASEDVGEADPNALQLAVSTMHGCQMLGMPESDVLLAQCALYLAKAPKSRAIDNALSKAKCCIAENHGNQPGVPVHLRNAPNKLLKDLGYGKSGDYTGFMPEQLKDVKFV